MFEGMKVVVSDRLTRGIEDGKADEARRAVVGLSCDGWMDGWMKEEESRE
jgi:hypothetical protein